jgi:hypothetical protein
LEGNLSVPLVSALVAESLAVCTNEVVAKRAVAGIGGFAPLAACVHVYRSRAVFTGAGNQPEEENNGWNCPERKENV